MTERQTDGPPPALQRQTICDWEEAESAGASQIF